MIRAEIQYQVPLYVAPTSLIKTTKIAGNGSEDYTAENSLSPWLLGELTWTHYRLEDFSHSCYILMGESLKELLFHIDMYVKSEIIYYC